MEMSPHALGLQVSYSQWATSRLLTLARTLSDDEVTRHLGNSHGTILRTFQHTYYADRTWFGRLEGTPPASFEDPAPGPSLGDLEHDWLSMLARMADFARHCDPMQILSYKNLKGQPFERPYWQVILHVVNHATYHRGQVASLMRQLGAQPPSTDLIYYYLSL